MGYIDTPPAAQPEQEPVAEVLLKKTGGNVGIATVIHEIYSHYREPLRVGDKLFTAPPAAQPTMFGPMGTVGDLFDKHVIANGNLNLKKEWIVYLEKNT
jgi:hypothetical protein